MYCFAKFCRICLSHHNIVHYGTRDKHNRSVYNKLGLLFPQLVNKTSQHFPIWICTKCQEQVNLSYEFKQKCYKTYKLLKKYSFQLYEANKDNNIPDVPTEIFQEVKPKIDKNIISLDQEDHSENYYNADDITIVKNELLPSNFKNEPEFHNMIQEIIENNFETIRQIDGADTSSLILKRELINNSEVNRSKTNNQRLVQEVETEQMSSSIIPEHNNESVQANSLTTSATDEVNEINNTTNPLDAAAFTLDYTNASFETFASYVAPSITVDPVSVANAKVSNSEESAAENLLNRFTRVLRQRKTICYKTMEKYLDELDDKICSEKTKKKSSSSIKKTRNSKYAVKQIFAKKEQKEVNDSVSSVIHPKQNNRKAQKVLGTVDSNFLGKVIKKRRAYFCDKCSKKYVIYSKFCLHTNKCSGSNQCAVCQKIFASSSNLRRHGDTHKLKVKCDLCNNLYSTKTALRNHIRTQHTLNVNKTNPFF